MNAVRYDGSACDLCAGRQFELIFELEIGLIRRCASCDLVSMVSRNDGTLVETAYDAQYFASGDSASAEGYADYFGVEAAERRRLGDDVAGALTGAFPNARSFLEVGCGAGHVLSALVRRGIPMGAAVGVDGSEHAIEMARRMSAGTFVHARIDPILPGDLTARFDVVCSFDVVEHFVSPVSAVAAHLTAATSTGSVVITSPDFGSELARRQGIEYEQFRRDHLYHLTPGTARRLLEAAAQKVGQRWACGVYDLLDWASDAATGRLSDEFVSKYRDKRAHLVVVAARQQ